MEGKWGYIDQQGNLVISPQFTSADSFSDGLAQVRVNGKYGFIDPTGKMAIPPQFDQVDSFYEGLAAYAVKK
jgi:hypothetical protein